MGVGLLYCVVPRHFPARTDTCVLPSHETWRSRPLANSFPRSNDTVSIRWQFESQETITELVGIGLLTTAGCTSGVRQAVFQGSTNVPMFHTVTLSATHQFEWRVPNTVFLSPE